MAKIAYIILCHKSPDAIIAQAESLTAYGDYVSIHFDARAPKADYDRLTTALEDNPNVAFAKKRLKCGWGEWSLVQASLNGLECAVEQFRHATHFYLISGDCAPIKSGKFAHEFLDADDVDYIEHNDFFESNWIKTGFKEERLIYRHFFNERTQSKRFYASYNFQRKFGITRDPPKDIQIQIGSQWFCLRRQTVEKILDFIRARKDVMAFFRTTWIPDETFFQTLVCHLVPSQDIRNRTLTFLIFTDYGLPVNFHNDHYEMLINQNYIFARKISAEATELKERLGTVYNNNDIQFELSNDGIQLYKYMAGRGRIGQRFASRFWEAESTIGRSRELKLLICKKWHVAKRLLTAVDGKLDFPSLTYLFNERDDKLPDLGGIENSMSKLTRHRRAVVRLLFDGFDSKKLLICIDPANFDTIQDFCSDRSKTSLLELQCNFSDDYLKGHAKRVGLASERTSDAGFQNMLPTIRRDIIQESDGILDAQFENHYILHEDDTDAQKAKQIVEFLELDPDKALEVITSNNIFAD